MKPTNTGSELMRSDRVSSSCSTSGIRHVDRVTNPVICHEWGKGQKVEHISVVICDTDIPHIVSEYIFSLIQNQLLTDYEDNNKYIFPNNTFRREIISACWEQKKGFL
jgi:hypothetical protein